jgi:hypothetical protein
MKRLAPVAALLLAILPAGANACVWLPVPEQSRAEKRHWSREQTKERQREASQRLVSTDVNFASELAEILVPNIRPVRLSYSSCGPEGEIDFAGGADEKSDGLTDDTRLKGVDLSDFRRVLREFDGETLLGPSCNAEFRGRFATWLRTKLADNELRTTWLFLTARTRERGTYGSVYHRLMSFDVSTRRPPIRWWGQDEWIRKDIDRFNKKNAVGPRLSNAMSAFWAQQEPTMASDELVCPQAVASWQNDRERLIDTILRERDARMLRRKQRQITPAS